jgi:hypothetical protein
MTINPASSSSDCVAIFHDHSGLLEREGPLFQLGYFLLRHNRNFLTPIHVGYGNENYSGELEPSSPLTRRAEDCQTGAVRPRCSSVLARVELPGEVAASLAAGRAGGLERGKPVGPGQRGVPQGISSGHVSLVTFLPRSKKVTRPPGRDPATIESPRHTIL